jgi:hypothetical protein
MTGGMLEVVVRLAIVAGLLAIAYHLNPSFFDLVSQFRKFAPIGMVQGVFR